MVTTARGGRSRSWRPSEATVAALRASWRATTSGACAASRNMRVAAGSRLFGGRAELGDEVVGITAEIGLAELGRAAIAQEADAFDEQARIAYVRVQQL